MESFPYGGAVYVTSVKDRAFIERLRTADGAAFRIDWVMYLFCFMAGPTHFGIPFGRRISGEWMFTYKSKDNWIRYRLPPPAGVQYRDHAGRKILGKTCLICLAQFLVAPELRCIAAFNEAGTAWGCPNPLPGSLCVTYLVDVEVLLLLAANRERQEELRREFIQQESLCGRDVIFASPLGQIPRVPRGRGEAFDPSTCGCGSTQKERGRHMSTVLHKNWIAAQGIQQQSADEQQSSDDEETQVGDWF